MFKRICKWIIWLSAPAAAVFMSLEMMLPAVGSSLACLSAIAYLSRHEAYAT